MKEFIKDFVNIIVRPMILLFAIIGVLAIFIRDVHIYNTSNELERTAAVAYSNITYGGHYEIGDMIIAIDWRD